MLSERQQGRDVFYCQLRRAEAARHNPNIKMSDSRKAIGLVCSFSENKAFTVVKNNAPLID